MKPIISMLSESLSRLKPDPWRRDVGFSDDVADANAVLFGSADDREAAATLNEWIQRFQPCLFGRIAAKCEFLSFCILREENLFKGDEFVRDRIQDARLNWTRAAYDGRKNGFIIALISPRIASAIPDDTVKNIALRLASLYLREEVREDAVFHDLLWLEKPGPARTTWQWKAGVNYFSAQGDRRWWQDHRFPGGMVFSINSVGHMVKSGIISKAMAALDEVLDITSEDWPVAKVDSLEQALVLAMKTISNASRTVSGPATQLIRVPAISDADRTMPCTVALPTTLVGSDTSSYIGRYHTDFTIPSEYFLPDVTRPAHLPTHVLDFTYLVRAGVDNPDHETMGRGRQIRDDRDVRRSTRPSHRIDKMVHNEVPLQDCPRLLEAIARIPG